MGNITENMMDGTRYEECPSCKDPFGMIYNIEAEQYVTDVHGCDICHEYVCDDCGVWVDFIRTNAIPQTPTTLEQAIDLFHPKTHILCKRCLGTMEILTVQSIPQLELPLYVNERWWTNAGRAEFERNLKGEWI
jgi:hypothetical protein